MTLDGIFSVMRTRRSSVAIVCLLVGLNADVRYLAAALKVAYSGISESKVLELLGFVALGMHIECISLKEIKQRVFEASCIPLAIKKIMRCPQCRRWSLTNRVFCQECSKNLTINDDWRLCALSNCRCNCNGNKEKWRLLTAEERREATCDHYSKQPTDQYVLFIPPEAVIADYINMGFTNEMVGLKEDQIKELAKDANSCGFHHILLTQNSKRIYEAMGFAEAAEAVENHLSRFQSHDGMSVLSRVVDEALQSDYYKPNGQFSVLSDMGNSSMDTTNSRQSQKRSHPDVGDSNESQCWGIPFYQLAYSSSSMESDISNTENLKSLNGLTLAGLRSNWSTLMAQFDLIKCRMLE